jgi:flagellum-specific ATP synthase
MSVFAAQLDALAGVDTAALTGRVTDVTGLTVAASRFPAGVGSTCRIERGDGRPLDAQVIGFRGDQTLLMPLADARGVRKGDAVRNAGSGMRVPVGDELLGRVINGLGQPIDGGPPLALDAHYPLHRPAPEAMSRRRLDTPLGTGVRAIDAMLTIGRGQRLGIFAGTGVGKSVLLGMIARYTAADVIVLALVGERGREVGDFLEKDLGDDARSRSVVMVSTSDESPVMRTRAAFAATAVAEYFRDRGADVLLLMDSITRVAMAQRQIGLAAGEPPATKGYTPGVFALLPPLLERAGRTAKGSITGFYSVLVEGDDINEPISDAVRGILDGHVWLSRPLANRRHYPAIGVLESVSRIMIDVVPPEHLTAARRVAQLMATWEDIADLVNIGAYAPGSNPAYDLVIQTRPAIDAFLQQRIEERVSLEQSRAALLELYGTICSLDRKLNVTNGAAANRAAAVAR